MSAPEPVGAELVSEHLLAITWSDGPTLHYPLDQLRAACPCATCATDGRGDESQPAPHYGGIGLKSLEQVGSYAFRITFSDGHDLGIYTWPKLRAIGYAEGQAPPPSSPPEAFEV